MYRFSTNVKKIIHNDKLVLINLNTGQWIRMSMTVYKIIDKFIVKNEYKSICIPSSNTSFANIVCTGIPKIRLILFSVIG